MTSTSTISFNGRVIIFKRVASVNILYNPETLTYTVELQAYIPLKPDLGGSVLQTFTIVFSDQTDAVECFQNLITRTRPATMAWTSLSI